jgi:Fic family protein
LAHTTPLEWEGRIIEAANPPLLRRAHFALSTTTVRRTEQAAAAVVASARPGTHAVDVVGRLLLRAEGLASSAIEGLRASAADVALAEVSDPNTTASWVADNLAVVTDALQQGAPLAVEHLLAWHRRLMRHAPDIDRAHVGAWRDRIGWVGGPNPLLAAHVGAPPKRITPLMKDLLAFVNRDDVDPITSAAVTHAQFETIHPFSDGNGRIGRVLIGWILATRLGVAYPPPVSLEFARDIGGYQSGLTLYRQDGIDTWVRWFADAVAHSAARTETVVEAVAERLAAWEHELSDVRADAAARRLLMILGAHPVLSAATAAELLDTSTESARNALLTLAARGIVQEIKDVPAAAGRPRRWWVAQGLLDLVGR